MFLKATRPRTILEVGPACRRQGFFCLQKQENHLLSYSVHLKEKAVKKLALLALVAVMSFGLAGCAASRLYSQWGMERRGIGYVQEVRKGKESGIIVYSVVIHYKGRPSEPFRTYEPAFLSLNVGDEVRLELSHYVTIGG